ncbi:SsrA-binding protein SmpB [Sandaracinus amylolyticus]|uniref:SsrA-binding protein n=1 Tax=Sandaracinus amylolyticus TaxID=927083 RepID=A0A0F6SFB8_9BACT|nr:SsrA-binding protein SmpB [Sandaracinus amylolyticus]AKF06669.1 tmRNA-binding protein SmpB [Sandaracinus amylolyticus]
MKNAKKGAAPGEKLVARNPKATQRYELEERLEAGLVLTGSEVKSLRAGRADLEAAFARIENGQVYLHNLYIPPYGPATAFGHDPRRTRKLLLHAGEIEKWSGRITTKGYTLVPVRLYFKGSWVKVELGLGKGKKQGDEREKLKREVDLKEARAAIKGAKAR